jgi:Cadmium resistance transporter
MPILTVLGSAAIIFVITNVDAFVVLTLLFAASRSTGVPRPAQIVAGQYLGFIAWVIVSVVAAAGLRLVPDAWVGLLGVVPLALGLHGLLRARHRDPTYVPATGTLSVAVLTIANGIDNVTVYVFALHHPATQQRSADHRNVFCPARRVVRCRRPDRQPQKDKHPGGSRRALAYPHHIHHHRRVGPLQVRGPDEALHTRITRHTGICDRQSGIGLRRPR